MLKDPALMDHMTHAVDYWGWCGTIEHLAEVARRRSITLKADPDDRVANLAASQEFIELAMALDGVAEDCRA